MKLIIDIGNTRTKLAVFSGSRLQEVVACRHLTLKELEAVAVKYPRLRAAVLSSVIDYPARIDDFLKEHYAFLKLETGTPVPVKIKYKTPETLGKDRIALAVAARATFPGQNVLVIDAGTTITYDFVNSGGEYLGGSISPGIRMRLKALHAFTGKLPLIENPPLEAVLIGDDTQTAIVSGVLNGTLYEAEGIITAYRNRFPGLQVVLSGGDEKYFDKRLKNNIFALPNFVLTGLKEILDFNEKKSED